MKCSLISALFAAFFPFGVVQAAESPSCRWSTWYALRAGMAPRPNVDTTLQGRA